MLAVVFLLSFFIGVANCEDDQTMALIFLNQYGYLSSTRSGNHDVSTAIRQFQKFYGLQVSGKLDQATVRLMKKPRCGVSDHTPGGRLRRYVTTKKWSKAHLKYYVQPGQDLPHKQQREIFGQALQFWSKASSLTFSEVNTAGDADIKISFGRNFHARINGEGICPLEFDGPGGTLAHADFPEAGRAHFDEDETFTHNTRSGINLLWVAVHEFGHSLGLKHTNIPGAIMYPYYSGYVPDMKLHSDDIAGIQYLYGHCKDKLTTSCQPFKEASYCDFVQYRPQMTYWCLKTCFNCVNPGGSGGNETPGVPAAPGNCKDKSPTPCQPYKEAGYCVKYRPQMTYWCLKTCFNCNNSGDSGGSQTPARTAPGQGEMMENARIP